MFIFIFLNCSVVSRAAVAVPLVPVAVLQLKSYRTIAGRVELSSKLAHWRNEWFFLAQNLMKMNAKEPNTIPFCTNSSQSEEIFRIFVRKWKKILCFHSYVNVSSVCKPMNKGMKGNFILNSKRLRKWSTVMRREIDGIYPVSDSATAQSFLLKPFSALPRRHHQRCECDNWTKIKYQIFSMKWIGKRILL